MKSVGDILNKKGRQIWSVPPNATVFQALQLMAEKNIGAVLVMDGGEVVGIMSERDYARKVILLGKSSKETPVKDIMTTRVVFVESNKSAENCLALMTEKRFRHLPVYDGEKLAGLVSIGDVVKAVIDQQQVAIEELENYIVGRR
ncbi:MAG: CBS domain-containing protein [Calditrichia bacterium]